MLRLHVGVEESLLRRGEEDVPFRRVVLRHQRINDREGDRTQSTYHQAHPLHWRAVQFVMGRLVTIKF